MPDIEEGSGSTSSGSEIVEQVLGSSNEYLIRLMEKVMDEKLKHSPVIEKFRPIATKLEQEITTSKGKSDLPSLLVNTLLREKLTDRSNAESNQRQKIILIVLTVVLPLVTNAIQFALSFHFRDVVGSG